MKVLRIVFCVLSCACVASSVVLGALFGLVWFFVLIALAALFAVIMLLCKRRSTPLPPPAADFMNSDEENAKRNAEREAWEREHQDRQE